ncbi:MAG TPA: hypothetical protein RMH26_12555, partial [Polyangiaceae bacterium LLY-WYZ-15_(1-7)]|nr:hypothetical protein [Polyangiaceae bacterium LLY-WYZ-15_(1-7)]
MLRPTSPRALALPLLLAVACSASATSTASTSGGTTVASARAEFAADVSYGDAAPPDAERYR